VQITNQKPADLVYEFILDKIQSGQWPPNSRIWTENKLTDELKVSRVAVRDAIQKLSAMSVLRKVQGSGTYVEGVDIHTLTWALLPVASISEEDFFNIMEFRLNFEVGNITMFINRCTDAEIELLEENYRHMVEHQDSLEMFYQADSEFHHIIAKGTRNFFVIRISELWTNLFIEQHKRIRYTLGPKIGVEDHALLLRYIKERDAELAALHMRRHIKRIMDGMKQHLNRERENA